MSIVPRDSSPAVKPLAVPAAKATMRGGQDHREQLDVKKADKAVRVAHAGAQELGGRPHLLEE